MGSTVNETLGSWSEWFMLLAALTYTVAFVAFVWDMASHSKALGRAQRGSAEQTGDGSRRLVGASAASSAGAARAGSGQGALTVPASGSSARDKGAVSTSHNNVTRRIAPTA